MIVERLWERIVSIRETKQSSIAQFSCGETKFDQWLNSSARAAESRGECNVHICIDAYEVPVAFFTLSSTSIRPNSISNKLRGGMSVSIPATLLGKMGVRTDIQGNGCGTKVLHHAMSMALESSKLVSSRLLVVDALTTDLVPWYEARGFRKLPNQERRLVLKMSDVANICNAQDKNYFMF